jgi:hypothetical protein
MTAKKFLKIIVYICVYGILLEVLGGLAVNAQGVISA